MHAIKTAFITGCFGVNIIYDIGNKKKLQLFEKKAFFLRHCVLYTVYVLYIVHPQVVQSYFPLPTHSAIYVHTARRKGSYSSHKLSATSVLRFYTKCKRFTIFR